MDFKKLTVLIVVGVGYLPSEPESNIRWIQTLLFPSQGRVVAVAQKHQSWEVEVSEGHGAPVYQGEYIQFCRKKKQHILCRTMVGGVDATPIYANQREL